MAFIQDSEHTEQGSDPSTPSSGTRGIYPKADGWYDIDDAGTVSGPFASQRGNTALLFTQTADKTIANTVAETTLIGTGVGSVTLPAASLAIGTAVRVFATGHLSTTGTPTINIKTKLGGTELCVTGVKTLGDTLSAVTVRLWLDITCRTTGGSGTVVVSGLFRVGPDQMFGMTKTSAVTVDTTGTLAINVTGTWGTASSSNTITFQTLTVQRMAVTGLS